MLYESFKLKNKQSNCLRDTTTQSSHLLAQIWDSFWNIEILMFVNVFGGLRKVKSIQKHVLQPQEPSQNDSGQNPETSFFDHFLSNCLSKSRSISQLFYMFIPQIWGFGYAIRIKITFPKVKKLSQSKRMVIFSGLNIFGPKIIQNVSIFQPSDQSHFDPVLLLQSTKEICSTSHLN